MHEICSLQLVPDRPLVRVLERPPRARRRACSRPEARRGPTRDPRRWASAGTDDLARRSDACRNRRCRTRTSTCRSAGDMRANAPDVSGPTVRGARLRGHPLREVMRRDTARAGRRHLPRKRACDGRSVAAVSISADNQPRETGTASWTSRTAKLAIRTRERLVSRVAVVERAGRDAQDAWRLAPAAARACRRSTPSRWRRLLAGTRPSCVAIAASRSVETPPAVQRRNDDRDARMRHVVHLARVARRPMSCAVTRSHSRASSLDGLHGRDTRLRSVCQSADRRSVAAGTRGATQRRTGRTAVR